MTMQEWKAKINGFFQPKSQAERQKMMKYVIVMPAAILCGIVILWLLYSSLNGDEPKTGNAFNTEIPDGENDGIKSKAEEYAAAEVAKEKEQRQVAIANLDTLSSQSPDTVVQSSAIETSAQTYQEVQASLDDFFIPENSETSQVAELQARIDELEAQNTMAQQTQQPDQMEMLERSYQLAAQYMGNGNGGNYQAPQQQDDEKGKRNVQPVAQVSRNVVSSLGSSSNRSFNTSVGTKSVTAKNTIAAVVAGNQSVIDGESVKLRTTEPMWIGNRLIPRNTTITGSGRVQGERLEIEITSIEC
ncbi:conjugative transposon protein TraM, partial [uncultured Muribaculum sp.]|uniref:conjugative transposon protein TraM n=1 Tax=uncultured Muribaculum sp. TaxID=1918613 RepID=UPI00265A9671